MNYIMFEEVLNFLHAKKKEKLLRQINGRRVEDYTYELALYQCQTCYKLSSKQSVKIELKDKEIIEVNYDCPKCRKEMKKLEEFKIDGLNCPSCKEKKLEECGFILWD